MLLCSNHPDTNAVSYCKQCKKHMCAKCVGCHDTFFGKDHESAVVRLSSVDSSEDLDFSSDKCTEHTGYPLEAFCSTCNCKRAHQLFALTLIFFFYKVSAA